MEWIPENDSTQISNQMKRVVSEFYNTFVHMDSYAHKKLPDDLLRMVGQYLV